MHVLSGPSVQLAAPDPDGTQTAQTGMHAFPGSSSAAQQHLLENACKPNELLGKSFLKTAMYSI